MKHIHLQEVEIINMLGCDAVHLCLDTAQPVTLLLSQQDDESNYNPVTTALELIVTPKYTTLESLALFRASFHLNSCVRIVLRLSDPNDIDENSDEDDDQPCTSRQALERENRRRLRKISNYARMHTLRAERYFNPDKEGEQTTISYTLNNSTAQKMSAFEFFDLFFGTASYSEANLMSLYNSCGSNWLSVIDVGAVVNSGSDGSPFEALINILTMFADGKNKFLGNLTEKCLAAIEHGIYFRHLLILKIFTQVRSIFDYITCFEYTVWFFIPKLNQFKELKELSVQDLDFTGVKTYIRSNSDEESITEAAALGKLQVWGDAKHTIKEMLLIAFQLALANACSQPFLIIKNLHSFRNYQCLKFATAAFFKKTYKESDVEWSQHNYLSRIVHVASRLESNVIIEYPGGLPSKLDNANAVKCEYLTNQERWAVMLWNKSPSFVNEVYNLIDELDEVLN